MQQLHRQTNPGSRSSGKRLKAFSAATNSYQDIHFPF